MSPPLAVVVLAAGLGTRTKVSCPKVLLPLCGRSLVATVLATVAGLDPERIVVVLHHGREQVEEHIRGLPEPIRGRVTFVDQGTPRGTGHAVQVAMGALPGFAGEVLVAYGDMPLITGETLASLRLARGTAAASLLTSFDSPPAGMGRILRDGSGGFLGIREERDCSDEELRIEEFNAGFYCFDAAELPAALADLQPTNTQGELYLTDTAAWFLQSGKAVNTLPLPCRDELYGVNDLRDLAFVRGLMQERILDEHLANGVIVVDPASTFIDQGVEIGADTTILPFTVIGTGVTVGCGCIIGPFSHLRNGTDLADTAEIGNFVEAKKSVIGRGTKAKHLTYLGDATIGEQANIGAGTITANYDGKHKHQTKIGDRAFVGSGTVLVAPVTMGEGSMTGAGAVVTRNTEIADGQVVVGIPARPLQRRSPPPPSAPDAGPVS